MYICFYLFSFMYTHSNVYVIKYTSATLAVAFQQRWKQAYPSWEHRMWTDQEEEELIRTELPEMYPVYKASPLGTGFGIDFAPPHP